MEPSANLLLSESELANVQDAGWILTKHLIMEKAAALLRSQVNEINNRFGFLIKEEGFRTLTSSWPKISKGEIGEHTCRERVFLPSSPSSWTSHQWCSARPS